FPVTGRFLILDSLLTFCTVLTTLALGLAARAERPSWKWLLIASLGLAMGVLTKGPVAMVLCVPPMIAVGWLNRRSELTSWRLWAVLFTPTLLTTIPWFALMISR